MPLSAEEAVKHFLRRGGKDKQLLGKCDFFIVYFLQAALILTFLVIYFLSLITCQLFVIEDCPYLL